MDNSEILLMAELLMTLVVIAAGVVIVVAVILYIALALIWMAGAHKKPVGSTRLR